MNRRVYIAGPIANGHTANPRTVYKNVRNAERFYEELIKAGWTPILPHLSYHAWVNFENDVHWPRWIELDLDLLDIVCAIVRIPGESIGADMEIQYAVEKNIHVVKCITPNDAVEQLEAKFGKPESRPELQKYLDIITGAKY